MKDTWLEIAKSQIEKGGVSLAQLNNVISNPTFKGKIERLYLGDLDDKEIKAIVEGMSFAECAEMARLFNVLSRET
ncbi:MAG: hypothetical protein G01um101416_851 [Microgenomates group bacterium Gr01-1014_16]|nr:MAG: hypothetical protein G01um101416_851 [Microgenomates group bacterium Gr01-1014_16]